MAWTELVAQFLNGLAMSASLFLVASGLSIIFGVTRIVNFAHGSFYMLGAYVAYSLTERLGATPLGYWGAIVLAALAVGVVGVAVEMVVLRRIYRAPELFQLLATFGLVLVFADAVLMVWGPQDLLGARPPVLRGAVTLAGQRFPVYDLFLIVLGPAVMGGLFLLFRRTRWGVLVRAATQDREMVAVLGVNQAWLFTSVFFLGAVLAGLGGALQLPRETINHRMDLQIIVDVFVVVVVGGMGSIAGAYLAAVLLSQLHAFGILLFPEVTIVLQFLVMAAVLVLRPWGLLGRPQAEVRAPAQAAESAVLWPPGRFRWAAWTVVLALVALPWLTGTYTTYVAIEVLVFMLFAASLHFLLGNGGMISFGHAAYFGLGAYGAALAVTYLGAPMLAAVPAGVALAAAGALLYGYFCVRLTGIYMAMLTLAFAQITYAVAFQWYGVTGGDNGLLGIWPPRWAMDKTVFYYVVLALCGGGVLVLRRVLASPFGYSLRAGRDSPLRAQAVGLHVQRNQWLGFALAGAGAGLAGALYAFFKGSVFPDTLYVSTSLDALVMVLLGGLYTTHGALVGAALYKTLQITMSTYTDYWQLVLGCVIVLLVVAFPQGVAGFVRDLWLRFGAPATDADREEAP